MDVPESVVDAYTAERKAIADRTRAEIRRIAGMLDWSPEYENLVLNREAMVSVTADIVAKYGAAASASAAELFEAMDEAYTGTYRLARLDADTALESVTQSVHYAAGSLFPPDGSPPDVEAFVDRVCGAAVRMVNRQSMDTMRANSRPGIMFRRVTEGDNVCPLCRELAERGYVWDVDELIEPHDDCNCSLIPGFGEEPRITGNPYPELDSYF